MKKTKRIYAICFTLRSGAFGASGRNALVALCLLFAMFMLTTGIPKLYAQNLTGEIDGVVKDPTGAVIPDATVTVKNTDQNLVVRTITSNGQGQFTAPLLAIGHYAVIGKATGFQTTTENLDVHVGMPVTVSLKLTPGTTAQTVQVTASQLQPQLDTAAAGTLISNRQITQLSLSSRNFMQMLYLQPGVSGGIPGPDTRGSISTSGKTNVQNFSVSGLPNNSNGYYLDGQDINKRLGQQTIAFPGIDFIQEMNLQRAGYGAQYGGPGSAVVTVETKSGTTAFHGGAYEFFRSQILDANGYFNNLAGVPRPGLRYNDYGYQVGGPVWIPHFTNQNRTKTFFYFGQEFLREEVAVQQNITNIPTAAQRQGVFSAPVCIAYNAAGKCTKSTTDISKFDATAQAYLKDIVDKVPLPNNPNDPQGLIATSEGFNNETQTFIRIDHQFSQKLSAFFRYLDEPSHVLAPNGFLGASAIPGIAVSRITDGSTSYLGHATYVINPNNVLDGGYGYRPDWVNTLPIGLMLRSRATDVNPTLPYPVNTAVEVGVPAVTIFGSNYASPGIYTESSPVTQIFLNDTSTVGRHTLQFGVNLEYQKSGSDGPGLNSGTFVFSPNALPAGSSATKFDQAFAQFLTGQVSTFSQASAVLGGAANSNLYEAYAQDNFHASSRLTLNAGIRYSYNAEPSVSQFRNYPVARIVNFDPATFNPANVPAIDSNGLICTQVPCVGGAKPNPSYDPQNGLILSGQNSPYGAKVVGQPVLTFAPRVGFAWDVRGDGRMALRGGYGIYYLQTATNWFKAMEIQNFPNFNKTIISQTSFDAPGNGIPVASKAPVLVNAYQPNDAEPYLQSWSFDLQQQLSNTVLLDIGYYGNRTVHMGVGQAAIEDINQPFPGEYAQKGIIPGNTVTAGNSQKLNQIRPYLGYADISSLQTMFSSNYNSLQVSVQKRAANGTILAANYTYSKSLSNYHTPQNIYNLQSEYGPDGNDRTNIFNASFVYPLPFLRSQQGIIGHLLGGWETTGIVSYGSGLFLTAHTIAVDPGGIGLLDGPAVGRPDYLSNPNSGAPHKLKQWFNTNAFAEVPSGQYRPGNDSVGNILGPGYGNWDLSVFKNVLFPHSVNMQFRAESFNAFNHTNFAGVQTTLKETNYGQVTDAGPARVMQMAVKLVF